MDSVASWFMAILDTTKWYSQIALVLFICNGRSSVLSAVKKFPLSEKAISQSDFLNYTDEVPPHTQTQTH